MAVDGSMSTLLCDGAFITDDIEIPGQARLVESLGLDSLNPRYDPETISNFQQVCRLYEEYLYSKVHEALDHVMCNAPKYKHRRYVIVRADINNMGLNRDGNLQVPFHVAHYGMQRPDAQSELFWSRRDRHSWAACGIRIPPFKVVQAKLVQLGYYLVDMSYIGSKTHFRLYFMGPPSTDEYIRHIQARYPIDLPAFDGNHWFWHRLHEHVQKATLPC